MNWLTVVVVVLFVANIYGAHKKGFIKTLFETVSIIVAVLLTTVCAPIIAGEVSGNKEIYEAISSKVKMVIKEDDSIVTDEEQEAYIKVMPLPSVIKDYLRENNTIEVYEERGLNSFTEYVADGLTMMVIDVIAYVAVFLVIRIGLIIITTVVDLISKLPIVEEFDGMGGILIGAFKGILEIWILMLVITLVTNTKIGMSAMACISDSFILDMLYTNNVLLQIIYKFV